MACLYRQVMRVIFFLTAIALIGLSSVAHAGGPALVARVPLPRARQVAVQGDLAWVAQNFDGGALLNVRDPRNPEILRKFTPAEMQPVFLKPLPADNLLLCADRFRGLVIYDVRQPEKPTTVSQLALPGMTVQMDVTMTTDARRLALLARAGLGILAIDITDAQAPFIADAFTTGIFFTQTVAFRDGLVYLADGEDGGLKVLRLVAPGRFQPLYQANLTGKCETLLASGHHLFSGYGNHGIRIFDLPAIPDRPQETTPTLGLVSNVLMNRLKAGGMAVDNHHLAVAGGRSGVTLFNIADPRLPVLTGEFLFKDELFGLADAKDVITHRNFLLVPAWDAGLLILSP